MSKDSRPDAGEIYPRENLDVSDAVLPNDAKDSSEPRFLESFKTLGVTTIESPGFVCVQKGVEDHIPEDYNFGYQNFHKRIVIICRVKRKWCECTRSGRTEYLVRDSFLVGLTKRKIYVCMQLKRKKMH